MADKKRRDVSIATLVIIGVIIGIIIKSIRIGILIGLILGLTIVALLPKKEN